MSTTDRTGPNIVMCEGDSITQGVGSDTAVKQAGYRWLLEAQILAAGRSVTFVGDQNSSSPAWANDRHDGFPSQTVDSVRGSSLAARVAFQPEIIIKLMGINDIAGGSTAAQVETAYRTMLNDTWTTALYLAPTPAQISLKSVICMSILHNSNPTFNAVVLDFNANHLPGLIAEQVALGRDTTLFDAAALVTSFNDTTHPDNAGYAQMVAGLAPAVLVKMR